MDRKFVVTVTLWNVRDDDDYDYDNPPLRDIVPFEGRYFETWDEAFDFAEEMENQRDLDTWHVKEVFIKGTTLYEEVLGEYFFHEGKWYRNVGGM